MPLFGFLLRPLRKRFGADRTYYRIIDEIFGISPYNIELYKLALIHRSAAVLLPDGSTVNNERLEFLGDAILEAVVSDYLFIAFPEEDEGVLTRMRSRIVNGTTLNQISVDIGLAPHIISHAGGTFTCKYLYGDALEAMIGAIYLDQGYNFVNRLIIHQILREYVDLANISTAEYDFKSRLIEWCQKSRRSIVFQTAATPESTGHAPVFRSTVLIDGVEMGYGKGGSKKEAEQHASFAVSQAFADDDAADHLLELFDAAVEMER